MKQNFIFLVFIFFMFVCNPVCAQTVAVQSLSGFSTENPPATISVILLESLEIKKDYFLESGTVLNGNLVDVVSPKRLKRDADFSFEPKSYVDSNGKVSDLELNIKASYTETVDKAKVAKKAVVGVGNLFVKGFSMGVAAVEGAVKNTEGNRFKSSVSSVYEVSPFSYAKKGEDLNVQEGQIFCLKFPSAKKIYKSSLKEIIKDENNKSNIEKE